MAQLFLHQAEARGSGVSLSCTEIMGNDNVL